MIIFCLHEQCEFGVRFIHGTSSEVLSQIWPPDNIPVGAPVKPVASFRYIQPAKV